MWAWICILQRGSDNEKKCAKSINDIFAFNSLMIDRTTHDKREIRGDTFVGGKRRFVYRDTIVRRRRRRRRIRRHGAPCRRLTSTKQINIYICNVSVSFRVCIDSALYNGPCDFHSRLQILNGPTARQPSPPTEARVNEEEER
ncbi:hypothetical protein EVAR_64354_1 [Eumeta japonica]|uniref:Uncharacterized protein n=1 Tax=Eumeta variegata TaxID=151549 RepID=A0A4C1ZPD1_EUMVA|nr:hypothetical protein EVAR_64354_1 [Eumeta japonica]